MGYNENGLSKIVVIIVHLLKDYKLILIQSTGEAKSVQRVLPHCTVHQHHC